MASTSTRIIIRKPISTCSVTTAKPFGGEYRKTDAGYS